MMLDELRSEIERLRAAAAPLEPDSEGRRKLGGQALDHALAYQDQVGTRLDQSALVGSVRAAAGAGVRRARPRSRASARLCRGVRRPARLRDDFAQVHGLYPGRRACSIRRWATCSRRRRTNIRDSPRRAPARSASKMPARQWLASVIGYPETAAGNADVGRKHRQPDRRSSPRERRAIPTAAARSTRRASPIIASTRRCTSRDGGARPTP